MAKKAKKDGKEEFIMESPKKYIPSQGRNPKVPASITSNILSLYLSTPIRRPKDAPENAPQNQKAGINFLLSKSPRLVPKSIKTEVVKTISEG